MQLQITLTDIDMKANARALRHFASLLDGETSDQQEFPVITERATVTVTDLTTKKASSKKNEKTQSSYIREWKYRN